jgi:hypothetical protein
MFVGEPRATKVVLFGKNQVKIRFVLPSRCEFSLIYYKTLLFYVSVPTKKYKRAIQISFC